MFQKHSVVKPHSYIYLFSYRHAPVPHPSCVSSPLLHYIAEFCLLLACKLYEGRFALERPVKSPVLARRL